jgi:hypothetical protein
MNGEVPRTDIEVLIDQILKNSPRTIREALEEIRPPEPSKPRAKKRKTDIRTIRKNQRVYRRAYRQTEAGRLAGLRYESTLKASFDKLRREYKRRREKRVRPISEASWEWDMSLLEWYDMWASCPAVEIGVGESLAAWKCRGRRKGTVKVERIDPYQPFSKANVMITHGKKILYEPG